MEKLYMKLVIASNNAHKIEEFRTALKGLNVEVLSLKDLDFTDEIIEDEITEDSFDIPETFAEEPAVQEDSINFEAQFVDSSDDQLSVQNTQTQKAEINTKNYAYFRIFKALSSYRSPATTAARISALSSET